VLIPAGITTCPFTHPLPEMYSHFGINLSPHLARHHGMLPPEDALISV
jgi:hypothetical protein